MDWVEIVVSILSGLAVAIPLVIKLIEYVQKFIREKNWGAMLKMVIGFMETAENKFETGAEKKAWVLGMVQESAFTVNYDIDLDVISKMIDALCDMSNIINPPAKKAGE